MSLLFHKDFSDALTGANGFDTIFASAGTIAQSAGAGLNGTSGGVTMTGLSNSPNIYGRVTQDFTGKSFLRTAWYVDLSGLTIGTDSHLTAHFRFYKTTNLAALLIVVRVSGVLKMRHYLYNDSGSGIYNEFNFGAMDWIEIRIKPSSDGATADAESQLYFGGGSYDPLGELVSEITGVLHSTRFASDTLLVGMHDIFGGLSVGGPIILDEWSLRDDDDPILFGVSESAISRGMKYVLNRRRRKSYCW